MTLFVEVNVPADGICRRKEEKLFENVGVIEGHFPERGTARLKFFPVSVNGITIFAYLRPSLLMEINRPTVVRRFSDLFYACGIRLDIKFRIHNINIIADKIVASRDSPKNRLFLISVPLSPSSQ